MKPPKMSHVAPAVATATAPQRAFTGTASTTSTTAAARLISSALAPRRPMGLLVSTPGFFVMTSSASASLIFSVRTRQLPSMWNGLFKYGSTRAELRAMASSAASSFG